MYFKSVSLCPVPRVEDAASPRRAAFEKPSRRYVSCGQTCECAAEVEVLGPAQAWGLQVQKGPCREAAIHVFAK